MNIEQLVKSKPSLQQFIDIVNLSLSVDDDPSNFPVYIDAVKNGLTCEPPPYCSNNYYDFFVDAATDGNWLASSLIINSEREGDGATRLWSLASLTDNQEEKALIKKHAIDESAHSLGYLRLLDLVFPGAVTPEFRAELNQLSPNYDNSLEPEAKKDSPYAREPSIDDYIQMNIAEVRTTTHHIMQRESLLKYCPDQNKEKMVNILEALMKDELAHVAYTAKLIDKKAKEYGVENTINLYKKRLKDFNDITLNELSEKIFD